MKVAAAPEGPAPPAGASVAAPPAAAFPSAPPAVERVRQTVQQVPSALFTLHNGARYRTPVDLQVTPDTGARYLVVGGCLAEPMPEIGARINSAHRGDFLLLNNLDALPQMTPEQIARYDFQIIHIPLRSILGSAYFRLPDEPGAHEDFLARTEAHLARYLDNALKLNAEARLLSFVLGFLVPQQHQLGRFQARYDLRNVMHFVERLNMFLAAETAKRENVHFVDIDQVSSGIGKKSCQDDMVWSFTHGTTLSDGDHDHDLDRIDPPAPMQQYYSAKWLEFFEAVMHEIFAMYRTAGQRDMVKLVVVDLDDTLWRGVAAEGTLGIPEGWPMGFVETLLILKRRGILLAVVSKNDERFIRKRWNEILQGQIALEDFAAHRINFRSKADNLTEILRELNLRAENAVMIDDNPAERAAIQAGVPGLRVLGKHLYYMKRVLLWAPETQQRTITSESSRRTEMVQAQVRRERVRKALTHEEFLGTLELRASISRVESTTNLHMSRALELCNKTHQFNTADCRHTLAESQRRFGSGERLYVLLAEDRFTHYGLIGAAWVAGNCIDQMVMSCRALGLGLEDALLAHLAGELALQHPLIVGKLQPTDANLACRQLFPRNGFVQDAGDPLFWSRALAIPPRVPAHIRLDAAGERGG
jgi:FkbH-like protein